MSCLSQLPLRRLRVWLVLGATSVTICEAQTAESIPVEPAVDASAASLTAESCVGFDCAAGFENWKRGWSDEKKQCCCLTEGKGCADWVAESIGVGSAASSAETQDTDVGASSYATYSSGIETENATARRLDAVNGEPAATPAPPTTPAPTAPPTPAAVVTPTPAPTAPVISGHVDVDAILKVVQIAKEVDILQVKLTPFEEKARAYATADITKALAADDLNMKIVNKLIKVAGDAGVSALQIATFHASLGSMVASKLGEAKTAAQPTQNNPVSAKAYVALGKAIYNAKQVGLSCTSEIATLTTKAESAYSQGNYAALSDATRALGEAGEEVQKEFADWTRAYNELTIAEKSTNLKVAIQAIEKAKDAGLPASATTALEAKAQTLAAEELEQEFNQSATDCTKIMTSIELAKKANLSPASLSSLETQLKAHTLMKVQDMLLGESPVKHVKKALQDAEDAEVSEYELDSLRTQIQSAVALKLQSARFDASGDSTPPETLQALALMVHNAVTLGVSESEVDPAKLVIQEYTDSAWNRSDTAAIEAAVAALSRAGMQAGQQMTDWASALAVLRQSADKNLAGKMNALKRAKALGLPTSATYTMDESVKTEAAGQLSDLIAKAPTDLNIVLQALQTAKDAEVSSFTLASSESQIEALAKTHLQDALVGDKHFKVVNKAFQNAKKAGVTDAELNSYTAMLHSQVSSQVSAAKTGAYGTRATTVALQDLGKAILRGKMFKLDEATLDSAREMLTQHAETGFSQGDVDYVEACVGAISAAQMEIRPEWSSWAKTAREVRKLDSSSTATAALKAMKDASRAGLPAADVASIKTTAQQKVLQELDAVIAGGTTKL